MFGMYRIISRLQPGIIQRQPERFLQTGWIKQALGNTKISYPEKIKETKITDSETVKIVFENGKSCNFKSVWLRDSCRCSNCIDSVTKHKLYEFPQSDVNIIPSKVTLQDNSEVLHIQWLSPKNKTAHDSTYTAKWLSQFADLFNGNTKLKNIKDDHYNSLVTTRTLWNKKIIENVNVAVNYEDYMTSDSGLYNVLSNIQQYGISVIKGVPLVEKEVVKVSRRIAFVKETGYGKTFQVKINPHPKTHLTYTGKRFELHSDLAYYQNTPSAQLLHCIKAAKPDSTEQKEAGGISSFADAFYAIEWLQSEHPEYFHILSTTKVSLSYLDAQRNRWIRHQRSLIETNIDNEVSDFYCTEFSLRPPIIPTEKIVPFYKAHNCLLAKLNEEHLLWKFYLTPGDLVIFNNKRIVHGRDEYDPNKIERHLEGCYMDIQEIHALHEQMLQEGYMP